MEILTITSHLGKTHRTVVQSSHVPEALPAVVSQVCVMEL
jgi:hypothetical protein